MKILIDKGNISEEMMVSLNYVRTKHLLHSEIISFCKEFIELKFDLLSLREDVGTSKSYKSIREVAELIHDKYNSVIDDRIGITWHIETTRHDYSLILFVILQRGEISAKKFIFRYKKSDSGDPDNILSITRSNSNS